MGQFMGGEVKCQAVVGPGNGGTGREGVDGSEERSLGPNQRDRKSP